MNFVAFPPHIPDFMRGVFIFTLALPAFYLLGSAWESLFHEIFLDQPRFASARGFTRTGLLSELWFAHFSHHVVHHHLTYRAGYTEQFRTAEHRATLTAKLERLLDESQMRSVRASQFGLRFTWTGARQFGIPLMAACAAVILMCPDWCSRIALIAAAFFGTTPYLAFSRWVHAYLHRPFSDIGQAPWPMRRFLASRYGLAMRVGHFVHHRHPQGNFNLQLGYDVLAGKWRAPTDDEWQTMVEIALVTATHRQRMQGRRIYGHLL